jgi:large subunit ribosomal protein L4
MSTVPVKNINGDTVGSMELNDAVFGVKVNEHAVHMAVVQYLANRRQGTKSSKTRAEVRGGGRKPWRQKGTSPQWKGGGVVFTPKPRDFSFRVNKKIKRLAMKSALTTKLSSGKVMVLDELVMPEIKTKTMKTALDNLKIADINANNKMLIVTEESDKNVHLCARNLPGVKTAAVNTICVYDILKYDKFVVTQAAAKKISEVYS